MSKKNVGWPFYAAVQNTVANTIVVVIADVVSMYDVMTSKHFSDCRPFWGEFTCHWILHTKGQRLDVSFVVSMEKPLNKESSCQGFDIAPMRRHPNGLAFDFHSYLHKQSNLISVGKYNQIIDYSQAFSPVLSTMSFAMVLNF